MKLLVYMRDGRTCYALRGRAELRRLVGVEPCDEHKAIVAVRGTWDPVALAFRWQPSVYVRYLAKGSISHVEEGDPNQAAAPLAEREAVAA